ncbi:GIY-YIG nuclease family protein [Flavobacterium sp. ST-75]|uniref:GIY-YIG nuclease family protein n=1 Tax=Flavobacterium rhizophilum TaxID=3163296 RepID=A0ABW8Y882_9FLAO
MYTVYIIYSLSKSKYYIGQTNNIDDRIKRHNNKQSLSTKNGGPLETYLHYKITNTL